jgi:hypothetical protein
MFYLCGCEKENSNFENNLYSTEKHFVNIEKIHQIIKGQRFRKFINKFEENNQKVNVNKNDEISIIDFEEIQDKNNITAFYLTKLSNNKLLVFSADDRSHAIMGINNFSVDNNLSEIPNEFNYWIDDEVKAIEFAREKSISQTQEVKREWLDLILDDLPPNNNPCSQAFGEVKYPLLQTNWGQGTGYNNFTPNQNCSQYSNGHTPSGCVATATAQVMRYFEWPNSYNWSSMPNNFGNNNVSQLMTDIGNASLMDYGCDGSGTKLIRLVNPYPWNNDNPMKNIFGYNAANFGDYNYNVVLNELILNKPVILSGGEKKYFAGLVPYYGDGHAWIADGYSRGYECFYDNNGNVDGGYSFLYLHINWGWGGFLNGYFAFNNFSVNGIHTTIKEK